MLKLLDPKEVKVYIISLLVSAGVLLNGHHILKLKIVTATVVHNWRVKHCKNKQESITQSHAVGQEFSQKTNWTVTKSPDLQWLGFESVHSVIIVGEQHGLKLHHVNVTTGILEWQT